MDSLVSIIIPVYNRQDVLVECVHSITQQTYPHWEILLIDDGSTDNTLSLCQKLAKCDSRIHVLAAQHGGVSAARNLGLASAQGEFVFFIDSDDVIHPQLLDALVTGMRSTGASIAGTTTVNISTKKWHLTEQLIQHDPGPGEIMFHSNLDALSAMFRGNSPLNVLGGVMFRRNLIDKTRFRTDLHIGEDFFFIYENLIKGADAAFLTQKWYFVRIHSQNSSWDFSFKGFWSRFYRRELVWKSEESLGRTEFANKQKRNALSIYLDFLPRTDLRSDDAKQMRTVMLKYRPILFPALSAKDKLKFLFALYWPQGYLRLLRLRRKLKPNAQ